MDHYDYQIADTTIHFGHGFAEFLHKHDDITSHLYGQYGMKRFLDGLVVHCQPDTNHETKLYLRLELNQFRLCVKDPIKGVIVIIGAAFHLRHIKDIYTKTILLSLK